MATQEEIDAIYGTQIEQPAFEGAAINYKMERKGLLLGDPDTLAARELLNLQMRSANAIRNDGTAKSAFNKYVTSLGVIKVNWITKDKKRHDLMQELWEEFILNPNLDGLGTFNNTQAIWNSSIFIDGCSHTRMVFSKKDNPNRVSLKLQAIPSAMHDVLFNGESDKQNIRTGIKFDNLSKPIIYYYRKGIYEDIWFDKVNSNKHTKIPAKDIVHIFDRDSPGQWLGVPELASVIVSLYELDELKDATIAKQKAAQAIAWIVENTNPTSFTPTGASEIVKDTKDEDKVVFKAQGGSTQYMNRGEKIQFYQSTDIGENLPVLINSELRKIAASLGIPFHLLTGDTSGLDFSSLRAIAIELRKRLEYIHHFRTIPLGISRVCARFKELASLRHNVKEAKATYQLPKWYGVDDLKDSQADLLKLSIGGTTLQKILDDAHLTFEEVLESKTMMKTLGISHIMEGKADSGKQGTNVEPNSNSSE